MQPTANPPPRRAHPTDPPKGRNATTASNATTAPNPTTTPDPAALPNLTTVLRLVQILLTYGRHLAETFDRRSTSPGFHLIARHFGTSSAAVILAHIRRGILRAAALHHVLTQRAASGRDLTIPPLRVRLKPQPAAADPASTPAEAPKPKRPSRPSWRDDWLDNVENPLDPIHLPKFEDLVKQATRRPVGLSLADICADLGVAPALCQVSFWNDLFLVMMHYEGNPAIQLVRRWRREQHFQEEQDRLPTMDQSWPPVDVGGGRRDIIRVMGFFIGEPPVEPPLILAPEPPPWVHPSPAASAARSAPGNPPESTGPP